MCRIHHTHFRLYTISIVAHAMLHRPAYWPFDFRLGDAPFAYIIKYVKVNGETNHMLTSSVWYIHIVWVCACFNKIFYCWWSCSFVCVCACFFSLKLHSISLIIMVAIFFIQAISKRYVLMISIQSDKENRIAHAILNVFKRNKQRYREYVSIRWNGTKRNETRTELSQAILELIRYIFWYIIH